MPETQYFSKHKEWRPGSSSATCGQHCYFCPLNSNQPQGTTEKWGESWRVAAISLWPAIFTGGISFTILFQNFSQIILFSKLLYDRWEGGFTYMYVCVRADTHTHTRAHLVHTVMDCGSCVHTCHRLHNDTEGCLTAIPKTSPRYLMRENYFGTSELLSCRLFLCYLYDLISFSLFGNSFFKYNTCPLNLLSDF